MSTTEAAMRQLFTELEPGDQVEVIHEVKVGQRRWTTTSSGKVVKTERRRHGLHYDRNPDDKVWSDVIILEREDGERATVTMDEYTELKRLEN